MSTKLIFKTSTISGEETKRLSEKIGKRLRGGEVFVLLGDLGFGKTQFVKGLVHGAGITEEVTSPSFTISNVYSNSAITVHHMDYYRIADPGILKDELMEIINDKNNVLAIEWPAVMLEHLPINSIEVKINILGEDKREFIISYHGEFEYLFEDLE